MATCSTTRPLLGDFAVLPAVKFPTGDATKGTGTGTTDASFLLISSHSFGPVSMDINAGYTRRSGDGSNAPKNATLWTVSFGGPAAGQLGWTAECYGYPGTGGPGWPSADRRRSRRSNISFSKVAGRRRRFDRAPRGAATARALRGCRL